MIIGVIGLIGSGKGTTGDYLEYYYGFKKRAFAGPVKDVASIVFGWDRKALEGDTPESRKWREQPDPNWEGVFPDLNNGILTPRLALQKIGTEAMRGVFGDNIWVKSLFERREPNEKTVITDVRFQNEIEAILENGGHIWWVREPGLPKWLEDLIITRKEPTDVHQSEWDWAIKGIDRYRQIINTKEDLYGFHENINGAYYEIC